VVCRLDLLEKKGLDTEVESKLQSTLVPQGSPVETPNIRRVEAGRRNVQKRQGFTEEGLARLRAAALAHQPWRFSTGPRSLEGKARAASNGRIRQKGERSVRELKAALGDYRALALRMTVGRRLVAEE
jgi:hypothetical protein